MNCTLNEEKKPVKGTESQNDRTKCRCVLF